MAEREFAAVVSKRRVRKSNHEEALVSYAQAMRPGRKSASEIKSDLGISDTVWKRIVVKLKDRASEIAEAMAGVGVEYIVERRGSRTVGYLAK